MNLLKSKISKLINVNILTKMKPFKLVESNLTDTNRPDFVILYSSPFGITKKNAPFEPLEPIEYLNEIQSIQ